MVEAPARDNPKLREELAQAALRAEIRKREAEIANLKDLSEVIDGQSSGDGDRPLSPEQAKKRAYESTMRGGVDKVAAFLKENYNLLGMVEPRLASADSLTGRDYRIMAGELITSEGEDRGFTARTSDNSAVRISLKQIDQKLLENETGKQFLTSRNVKSVSELVPTYEQLSTTAIAVGKGVEEETGTIGFLGGATFMSALVGFFKWIGGLFTGESSFSWDSIKQSIASVSADNMKSSVTNQLQNLRQQRPDLARSILTQENVTTIGQQVHDTVTHKARGEDMPAEDIVENTHARSVDQSARGLIAQEVYNRTYNQSVASIHEEIEKQKRFVKEGKDKDGKPVGGVGATLKGWLFSAADAVGFGDSAASVADKPVPTETEINKASAAIASSISSMMRDGYTFKGKSIAEMNADEFAAATKDEVRNGLRTNRSSLLSFDDDAIAMMVEKSGTAAKEKFAEIPKLPNSQPSPFTQARNDAGSSTSTALVRGGQDADTSPAQPGGSKGRPNQNVRGG
jgi:hypothetical protein